jgi:hypothetical protein
MGRYLYRIIWKKRCLRGVLLERLSLKLLIMWIRLDYIEAKVEK